MIYMFLSNNPSSGDINLSNLSCYEWLFNARKTSFRLFLTSWPGLIQNFEDNLMDFFSSYQLLTLLVRYLNGP